MGTNYYVKRDPDLLTKLKSENAESEVLHIGKSSGGWCFSVKVYPERGIHDLKSWYRILRKGKNHIFDEYDREVTLDELLRIITQRSWPTGKLDYQSERHQYHKDGCRRHNVREGYPERIRHGVGPYDYLNIDFS